MAEHDDRRGPRDASRRRRAPPRDISTKGGTPDQRGARLSRRLHPPPTRVQGCGTFVAQVGRVAFFHFDLYGQAWRRWSGVMGRIFGTCARCSRAAWSNGGARWNTSHRSSRSFIGFRRSTRRPSVERSRRHSSRSARIDNQWLRIVLYALRGTAESGKGAGSVWESVSPGILRHLCSRKAARTPDSPSKAGILTIKGSTSS
jgi:hypothetical protein